MQPHRFAIRLDAERRGALAAEAARRGVTLAEVVRDDPMSVPLDPADLKREIAERPVPRWPLTLHLHCTTRGALANLLFMATVLPRAARVVD
jgi:hypothetical protein